MPLRSYAEGGSSQANPPLLPELIGALAAIDFLHTRPSANGETVAAGTGDGGSIGWDDLPFDGLGGPSALRSQVAAALRTSLAWRQFYGPALAGDRWQGCVCEAWFQRLLAREGDEPVSARRSQRAIEVAGIGFDGLLRWFVALSRAGAGGARRLTLLDDAVLAREWGSANVDEVRLTDALGGNAFSKMVPPRRGPTLAEVFERVTYGPVPPTGSGVGRVLAALHAACGDDWSGRA